MMERLDKLLTEWGIGSRSICKGLISSGRVRVGEAVITKPEFKLNREEFPVFVDGRCVSMAAFVYYVLNKPGGCVCATTDERHKTVLSYIKDDRRGLFPVGRLDLDTEGLLLITNDGDFAHRLLSPKNKVPKTYYALLNIPIVRSEAQELQKGVVLFRDGLTSAKDVTVLKSTDGMKQGREVLITITEGKYHQVKRMFSALGKRIIALKRIAFGGLHLDSLALLPGEYRELTPQERMLLYEKDTGLHI